jgi:metallo-beta-lactamase family protein
MVTGGRVLSYLEQYIAKPETTVIMVGYQAEGTRGRNCSKVPTKSKSTAITLGSMPKFLKSKECLHTLTKGLLDWLSELENKPERIFLVHGENQPADELRIKINEKYGFACTVALLNQQIEPV